MLFVSCELKFGSRPKDSHLAGCCRCLSARVRFSKYKNLSLRVQFMEQIWKFKFHKNLDFRRVEIITFCNTNTTLSFTNTLRNIRFRRGSSWTRRQTNVLFNHQFCAVSELLFYNVFLKFRLRKKRFWHVNSVDEDRRNFENIDIYFCWQAWDRIIVFIKIADHHLNFWWPAWE